MHQIGKEPKEFVLTFSDRNREREAIYLTASEFKKIHAWKSRSKEYARQEVYDLTDDKGNYVETVSRNDIRLRRSSQNTSQGEAKWVCGYGSRHPMSVGACADDQGKSSWTSDCPCKKYYGMSESDFLLYMQTKHGITFAHQITAGMRTDFKRIATL